MSKTIPQSDAPKPPTILLVEDDPTFQMVMAKQLEGAGYRVPTASDGPQAEEHIREEEPDLVLLDERLPGGRGIDLLRRIREGGHSMPVIFLTAQKEIDTAVEAIQAGAFHFFTKPCDLDELTAMIDRALAHKRNRRAALEAQATPTLIGESPAIRNIKQMAGLIAAADAPVLLTGESGTGKELLARLIHHQSPRSHLPFMALNCATLQDTLVEAELFGFEKGAFTGAARARAGLLEAAGGGILFLDELAELSLPAQAKLLRVLQEGSYRRLGSHEERESKARIIAATNTLLAPAIEEGRFRLDLYFRLNVLEVALPALRERGEDIPLLARHFYELRGQPAPSELESPRVQELLRSYSWPGNVRELHNVMERIDILSGSAAFDPKILEAYVKMTRAGALDSARSTEDPPERLAEVEMLHIHRILDRCDGNKSETAKRLGISIKTLYNKLNKEKGD